MEYVPFCGPPPVPSEIWSRWTLDPWLLGGLAIALLAGIALARDRHRFVLGWGLVALAFTSPLCAASMALFSARIAQHLVLTLIAAPVLAAALPRLRLPPVVTAAGFAVLFWFWHLPGPYEATLRSDAAYWAMHVSVLGGAVLLWCSLLNAARELPFAGMLALALTAAQMTGLAVALTFSARVWHPWHMATAPTWGLDAMQDQALSGAIMWVGGGALFVLMTAILATRLVRAEAAR
ncbi:MAG: cytochrome c oxidase assembly protein [Rhodobacteraceae bacterium]|nr:cytochrome c oxidase assembly protein [Paracoccaceae bacterium]